MPSSHQGDGGEPLGSDLRYDEGGEEAEQVHHESQSNDARRAEKCPKVDPKMR